jgi:hypothetical protein
MAAPQSRNPPTDGETEQWNLWTTDLVSSSSYHNNGEGLGASVPMVLKSSQRTEASTTMSAFSTTSFNTDSPKTTSSTPYLNPDTLMPTSSVEVSAQENQVQGGSSKPKAGTWGLEQSLDDPKQRKVYFKQVGNVYVYGAYLDLRLAGNFSVRLLSVKNKLHPLEKVACHIHDGAKKVKLYAQAYRMCEDHGKLYEGWIFSCVLPSDMQGLLPTPHAGPKNLPSTVTVVVQNERQVPDHHSTASLDLRIIPTLSEEVYSMQTSSEGHRLRSSPNNKQATHTDSSPPFATRHTANPATTDNAFSARKPKDGRNRITPNHAVNNNTFSATRQKIGVCVPPLFGHLTLSKIVNFIQMCKILGADQVFLYVGNVSSEIRKFLRHQLESDPTVSLVTWTLPGNLTASEDSVWYHGQILAVQVIFRLSLINSLHNRPQPRADASNARTDNSNHISN